MMIDFMVIGERMFLVAQSITGRLYSILLAPPTAHVVVQINDNYDVVAFLSDEGTKLRLV